VAEVVTNSGSGGLAECAATASSLPPGRLASLVTRQPSPAVAGVYVDRQSCAAP